MRILVADDEPVARRVLGRALRSFGNEVVVAEDGLRAWDLFVAEDVECVVTDWNMPGLSGLELCRRIRAHSDRSWSYLMLVTAREGWSDLVEGLRAGADEFMSKPFDWEVLRARLHGAMRVLGLERTLRGRVKELEAALAEVKTLRGLLPICMYCKKIRDEREAWQAIEHYVASRSDAQFSHGVCPDCFQSVVKPMLDDFKASAPSHE